MKSAQGKKPRYVIFLPWTPTCPGGVNGVVSGLALASRDRYEPVIVVTGWRRPGDYNGPWLYLPDLNPARPLGFLARLIPVMWRLRGLLKGAVAANPHFGGLECIPLVLLRKIRLGPPVIMSIHGSDVTEMLAETGWRRRFFRWLFGAADLVVGCSKALTSRLLDLSPSARTVTIFNATPPAPEVRAERPINGPYLLCVASFVQVKGHDILLSAFLRIGRDRPDLTLVLIGARGPTLPDVEARIAELGLSTRVRILVDLANAEVWWWMRYAECFVLPSRSEAFGIVLLEAGKSKVPIVATRVGGVPEFFTDGEHGLLCAPAEPEQLASAVLASLSDPEAARRRAEAFYRKAIGFTWSAVFEAYRAAAGLP